MRWGEGRGGGARAIVAGCNQSSANTGAHSHTYIHQRSGGDRAVPTALPPCGRDTLTPITRYRGQKGASQSASRLSSSRTQAHVHTHVDLQLGFSALIVRQLIQGWEEVECVLAQMSVWVWEGVGECCCCILWICVYCIHASAAEQNLSNYDFHSSLVKCSPWGAYCMLRLFFKWYQK